MPVPQLSDPVLSEPGLAEEQVTPMARPRASTVLILLVDLGTPTLIFYVLSAAGATDLMALAVGGVFSLVSTLVSAIRRRRLNRMALLALASTSVGLLLSLASGDARQYLVRGAWLSVPFATITLLSLRSAQPLCFVITRAVLLHRRRLMDALWQDDARFRRAWRQITIVWGVTALVDAGLRVVMAYTLPVASVAVLEVVLSIVFMLALQVPTHLLIHRAGSWQLLFGRRHRGSPEAQPSGTSPVE